MFGSFENLHFSIAKPREKPRERHEASLPSVHKGEDIRHIDCGIQRENI